MSYLTRESLYSLEKYAEIRMQFRARVMAEKKRRAVFLGDHVQLCFENKLTMQYQIQEMLRIEKIFEANGIEEELRAYNPLIPDGDNWKATMLIQYEDIEVRRHKLGELVGIENQVWAQVGQMKRVFAIADEDMDRADDTKTSAVHFLRFQLPMNVVDKVKNGGTLVFGIDHPYYQARSSVVSGASLKSLLQDLR